MLAACLVAAFTAAPARAFTIGDVDPDWQVVLDQVVANSLGQVDVALTATGTWICGTTWATNGPYSSVDATVARVATGTEIALVGNYDGAGHLRDGAAAIATRGEDAVYTVGSTTTSAGGVDLLVVRWNRYAAVKWARRLTSAGAQPDVAVDVGIDRDLNVVVCGTTTNALGRTDWVVASWSPSGKRRWVWKYSGIAGLDDVPAELVIDNNGNTYVTGRSGGLGTAFHTVKLSSAGKQLWMKTVRPPAGHRAAGSAIARRPGGGVYVAVSWQTADGDPADSLVMSFSPGGVRKEFAKLQNRAVELRDLTVTSKGVVIAVGRSQGRWGFLALDASWTPNGSLVRLKTSTDLRCGGLGRGRRWEPTVRADISWPASS